jgi:hypothetical protein
VTVEPFVGAVAIINSVIKTQFLRSHTTGSSGRTQSACWRIQLSVLVEHVDTTISSTFSGNQSYLLKIIKERLLTNVFSLQNSELKMMQRGQREWGKLWNSTLCGVHCSLGFYLIDKSPDIVFNVTRITGYWLVSPYVTMLTRCNLFIL